MLTDIYKLSISMIKTSTNSKFNPNSLNNQNGHYDILSQHTLCSKRTLKWRIQTD